MAAPVCISMHSAPRHSGRAFGRRAVGAMKKQYIPVYLGLGLFLTAFVVSALLEWAGDKQESRIVVCISVMLFGLTILIGLYSNVKNYGFFFTRVREHDANLSIEELDAKYPRISRGTTGYRVGIGIAALFGIATVIFGMAVLLRQLSAGGQ